MNNYIGIVSLDEVDMILAVDDGDGLVDLGEFVNLIQMEIMTEIIWRNFNVILVLFPLKNVQKTLQKSNKYYLVVIDPICNKTVVY